MATPGRSGTARSRRWPLPISVAAFVAIATAAGHVAVRAGSIPAGTLQSQALDPRTAVLTGTLKEWPRDAPLGGVRLGLATIEGLVMTETTTLEDGRFEFTGLRSGLYATVAMGDGYMVHLGSVFIEPARSVTREFRKGPVAVGRVVDPGGAPVAGVPVCALTRGDEGGEARLIPRAWTTTDVEGRFVLSRTLNAPLPSGRHVLAAMPAGCSLESSADVPSDTAARFVPSYFPGDAEPERATMLDLDARRDLTGLRLPLVTGAVTRLEGRIPGYSNSAVVPGRVILEPPSGLVSIVRTARISADGRFAFEGLVPGTYHLIVPPRLGPDVPFWARSTVAVAGQRVLPVTLTPEETVGVSGTLRFGSRSAPLYQVRVFMTVDARPVDGRPTVLELLPRPFAGVSLDGTFAMTGVMPGAYRLRVSGHAPLGLTLDSAVAPDPSHPLGTSPDYLDVPLILPPDRGRYGLRVTLAPALGRVTGVVTDDSGRPADAAVVLVFSADERNWVPGSRRVVSAPTVAEPRGSFAVTDLPAGRYLAVALRDLPADWPDAGRLTLLRPVATPFPVALGETRQVSLALVPVR